MTKHKLILSSVLGLALAGATVTSAHADARKKYRTDKSFGLGLMIGEPTGLSGKYHLDAPVAIAFGVGSSHYGHHHYNDGRRYRYYDHDGTHIHADVLWHPLVVVDNPTLQLPMHVGVGAQVREHEHYYDPDDYDGVTHLGVRVPFGLTMDFKRVPMDAFFELAYSLDFTGEDNHSYIAGSLGGRYYF